MPSPTGGRPVSFSSKLSWVGMPLGRLLRCQARAIVVLLSVRRIGAASRAGKTRRRRGRTPPGPGLPPLAGGSASTGLAVGALEAAVERARAHFALVLALEQGAAAA